MLSTPWLAAFERSVLKEELDRLEDTLLAFENWRKVEQTPNYRVVNIQEIVNREIQRLSDLSSVDFTVTLSDDLTFDLDSVLFGIIVSNALRNAVESTNEITYREKAPIVVSAGITNKCFWLSIIDDGVGLPSDHDVLYKSRYTTKPGNRGLGLAIIGKAIHSLKGDWELKKSKLGGAEFYFELPIKRL
ncbi:Autoinducer 2 sensor kinase/phosphatase LuxQ (plasmid) [Piscirickettsia salmonis]|uniref:histidine kinase n=1 Tax=Piscirickettsia salmonis TaxID=1238 RepID=A0AAC8VLT3_PISSA|nr:HAMP domain-containing sensor histidine kinase [Piscirickettsia salmonis]AKP74917.1 hypothetical protein PSLF89_1p109 [Piscirickettsia salmonis LF-89 = ATCC VR-1361]ALB24669.1 chemotaxis protein CheY [Piscirickettsia salmonis]ALY04535.1 hypothetical protein AWE47_16645 [Piscirickettsia salmonis]AMA43902.1 hypothetical protein AWJ11_16055 [Piscirickettsia salmonis]AOS37120.1 hypothetical protein AVM72_17385 [Piscirickettsia salmonis]